MNEETQKDKAEQKRLLVDSLIEAQAEELNFDLRITPLLKPGGSSYNLKRIAFADGAMAEIHYRFSDFYIKTPKRLVGDCRATYREYRHHIFVGLKLNSKGKIIQFVVRRLCDLVPPHLRKTPEKAFAFAHTTSNTNRFYPVKVNPFQAKASWKDFDGGAALFNNYSLAKTMARAIKGHTYL